MRGRLLVALFVASFGIACASPTEPSNEEARQAARFTFVPGNLNHSVAPGERLTSTMVADGAPLGWTLTQVNGVDTTRQLSEFGEVDTGSDQSVLRFTPHRETSRGVRLTIEARARIDGSVWKRWIWVEVVPR